MFVRWWVEGAHYESYPRVEPMDSQELRSFIPNDRKIKNTDKWPLFDNLQLKFIANEIEQILFHYYIALLEVFTQCYC